MHWHVNTVHPYSHNKYRIHTFWTLQEAWKRADLMEDARRKSKLAYMTTVEECEDLECLVDALAR